MRLETRMGFVAAGGIILCFGLFLMIMGAVGYDREFMFSAGGAVMGVGLIMILVATFPALRFGTSRIGDAVLIGVNRLTGRADAGLNVQEAVTEATGLNPHGV